MNVYLKEDVIYYLEDVIRPFCVDDCIYCACEDLHECIVSSDYFSEYECQEDISDILWLSKTIENNWYITQKITPKFIDKIIKELKGL